MKPAIFFLGKFGRLRGDLVVAVLAVAVIYIPIAILANGVLRTSIVYVNRCAVKICLLLITYFYFRRWLDRWIVTDFTNSFVIWVLAGCVLLLLCWTLFALDLRNRHP